MYTLAGSHAIFQLFFTGFQPFYFRSPPSACHFNFRRSHWSSDIAQLYSLYFTIVVLNCSTLSNSSPINPSVCIHRSILLVLTLMQPTSTEIRVRCFFDQLQSAIRNSTDESRLLNVWFTFIAVLWCCHIPMSCHLKPILLFVAVPIVNRLERCDFGARLINSSTTFVHVPLSVCKFQCFCFFRLNEYFNEVFIFKTIVFRSRICALHLRHCILKLKHTGMIDSRRYFTLPIRCLFSVRFLSGCNLKSPGLLKAIWISGSI